MKRNTGFSLVEILITVVLFGFLGTVATSTLFAILGGSAKTDITKDVKQNGDYALSVMETKIRNSIIKDTDCSETASSTLNLTSVSDNQSYSLRCATNSSVNRLYITKASTDSYLTATSVTVTNTSCAVFSCKIVNYKKIVTIDFTLRQKSTTVTQSEKASQAFKTQITLRNQ